MTAAVATLSAQTATAMDRRSLLRLLLKAAVCLVASYRANANGASAAPTERPTLTPVQAHLAAFGARLEAANSDAADRLFAYARQASGHDSRRPSSPDDACAALLEQTRVRREFRSGQTQSVDGWMLARSEAAACVFLHRFSSATAPA